MHIKFYLGAEGLEQQAKKFKPLRLGDCIAEIASNSAYHDLSSNADNFCVNYLVKNEGTHDIINTSGESILEMWDDGCGMSLEEIEGKFACFQGRKYQTLCSKYGTGCKGSLCRIASRKFYVASIKKNTNNLCFFVFDQQGQTHTGWAWNCNGEFVVQDLLCNRQEATDRELRSWECHVEAVPFKWKHKYSDFKDFLKSRIGDGGVWFFIPQMKSGLELPKRDEESPLRLLFPTTNGYLTFDDLMCKTYLGKMAIKVNGVEGFPLQEYENDNWTKSSEFKPSFKFITSDSGEKVSFYKGPRYVEDVELDDLNKKYSSWEAVLKQAYPPSKKGPRYPHNVKVFLADQTPFPWKKVLKGTIVSVDVCFQQKCLYLSSNQFSFEDEDHDLSESGKVCFKCADEVVEATTTQLNSMWLLSPVGDNKEHISTKVSFNETYDITVMKSAEFLKSLMHEEHETKVQDRFKEDLKENIIFDILKTRLKPFKTAQLKEMCDSYEDALAQNIADLESDADESKEDPEQEVAEPEVEEPEVAEPEVEEPEVAEPEVEEPEVQGPEPKKTRKRPRAAVVEHEVLKTRTPKKTNTQKQFTFFSGFYKACQNKQSCNRWFCQSRWKSLGEDKEQFEVIKKFFKESLTFPQVSPNKRRRVQNREEKEDSEDEESDHSPTREPVYMIQRRFPTRATCTVCLIELTECSMCARKMCYYGRECPQHEDMQESGDHELCLECVGKCAGHTPELVKCASCTKFVCRRCEPNNTANHLLCDDCCQSLEYDSDVLDMLGHQEQ